MTLPDAPDADCGALMLRLSPALSEYLRRESARRGIGAAELAERLLMRGIHQQRLDDATSDLCPCGDANGPTFEALLAARLEAGAMLGAFACWSIPPERAMAASDESASSATREILERLGRSGTGCEPPGPGAPV